ncbi:MAG: hypothetical protein IPN79_14820 [Saprospiraceae bacterium]|nr:hypothetical protein [Saprospiraceae bacterium]
MEVDCSFSWDPAKEFLNLAEEFINNKNKNRYQAMVILVMSAGIEAKLKEPFYKILPQEFKEVSNSEFCPLLYALFLINKKIDIPRKIDEIKKKYRSDRENPEFIDFQRPIQILMQLRNQIAHGKIIVQKSTILPKLAPLYLVTIRIQK